MTIYELSHFVDIVATDEELRVIKQMIDKILIGQAPTVQTRLGDKYVNIIRDTRLSGKPAPNDAHSV